MGLDSKKWHPQAIAMMFVSRRHFWTMSLVAGLILANVLAIRELFGSRIVCGPQKIILEDNVTRGQMRFFKFDIQNNSIFYATVVGGNNECQLTHCIGITADETYSFSPVSIPPLSSGVLCGFVRPNVAGVVTGELTIYVNGVRSHVVAIPVVCHAVSDS